MKKIWQCSPVPVQPSPVSIDDAVSSLKREERAKSARLYAGYRKYSAKGCYCWTYWLHDSAVKPDNRRLVIAAQ